MEAMDKLKKFIRSLLLSSKDPLPAAILMKDFREIEGRPIPYAQLGYSNVAELLSAMPDVARPARGMGGSVVYSGVADSSTQHIKDLVSNQKTASRKGGRRGAKPLQSRLVPTLRAPRGADSVTPWRGRGRGRGGVRGGRGSPRASFFASVRHSTYLPEPASVRAHENSTFSSWAAPPRFAVRGETSAVSNSKVGTGIRWNVTSTRPTAAKVEPPSKPTGFVDDRAANAERLERLKQKLARKRAEAEEASKAAPLEATYTSERTVTSDGPIVRNGTTAGRTSIGRGGGRGRGRPAWSKHMPLQITVTSGQPGETTSSVQSCQKQPLNNLLRDVGNSDGYVCEEAGVALAGTGHNDSLSHSLHNQSVLNVTPSEQPRTVRLGSVDSLHSSEGDPWEHRPPPPRWRACNDRTNLDVVKITLNSLNKSVNPPTAPAATVAHSSAEKAATVAHSSAAKAVTVTHSLAATTVTAVRSSAEPAMTEKINNSLAEPSSSRPMAVLPKKPEINGPTSSLSSGTTVPMFSGAKSPPNTKQESVDAVSDKDAGVKEFVMKLVNRYPHGIFLGNFLSLYEQEFPEAPKSTEPFTQLLPKWTDILCVEYSAVSKQDIIYPPHIVYDFSSPSLPSLSSKLAATHLPTVPATASHTPKMVAQRSLDLDSVAVSVPSSLQKAESLVIPPSDAVPAMEPLPANSLSHVEVTGECNNLSEPPPFDMLIGAYWNGIVLNIESTARFYVKPLNDNFSDCQFSLKNLLNEMESFYSTNKLRYTASSVVVDKLYAVQPDPAQPAVFRARAQSTSASTESADQSYSFFLVDGGETITIPLSSVFHLTDDCRKIPLQALLCSVYGMEHLSSLNYVTEAFVTKALGQEVVLEIVKEENGCKSVNVLSASQPGDESWTLADCLLSARTPAEDIVVTHVTDQGGYVYYQKTGPQLIQMGQLMKELNSSFEGRRNAKDLVSSPVVGKVYCCTYMTEDWYRVLVTKVESKDSIHVYYVDFGYISTTVSSSLRKIPSISLFTDLPPQAIRARLYCLKEVPESAAGFKDPIDDLLPMDRRVRAQITQGPLPSPTGAGEPALRAVPLIDMWIPTGQVDSNGEDIYGFLTYTSNSGLLIMVENEALDAAVGSPVDFSEDARSSISSEAEAMTDEEMSLLLSQPILEPTTKVQLAPLPAECGYWEVAILSSESPSRFTCVDVELHELLLELSTTMDALYGMKEQSALEKFFVPAESVVVGGLYAVPSKGVWRRGRVTEIASSVEAKVYLCDVGEYIRTEISNLRYLCHSFKQYPLFGFNFSLVGVAPSGAAGWTDEAVAAFNQIVVNRSLYAYLSLEAWDDAISEQEKENEQVVLAAIELIDVSGEVDVMMSVLLLQREDVVAAVDRDNELLLAPVKQ